MVVLLFFLNFFLLLRLRLSLSLGLLFWLAPAARLEVCKGDACPLWSWGVQESPDSLELWQWIRRVTGIMINLITTLEMPHIGLVHCKSGSAFTTSPFGEGNLILSPLFNICLRFEATIIVREG
jgi:hypothetical protein